MWTDSIKMKNILFFKYEKNYIHPDNLKMENAPHFSFRNDDATI